MRTRTHEAGLDGNALAGPLTDVFTVEMTTALGECRGCGNTSLLAEWAVYGPEPGFVARCPGCDGVLLRLVQATTGVRLDLSGVATLQLPRNASRAPS